MPPIITKHHSTINHQRGFIASLVTLLALILMLTIATSMSVIIVNRQKIIANVTGATQSYYAAEAGIEDALLRLKKNTQMAALSYSLSVNNATANVVIPAIVAASRAVSSTGTNNNLIKKVQVVFGVDSKNVSFYYGAQAGQGGLVMNNNSKVLGNVFSAGNISGSGTIDNDALVSGNGHSISGVYVGGNAVAYSCLASASVKNLTYVTGGTHTCTVRPGGTTTVQSTEITDQPLPIPQSQIDDWKTQAAAGGTIAGLTITSNQSLGPVKIAGNLTVNNGITLTVTGTLYVTGTVTFQNNAKVKLNSSYGTLGGFIISDGVMTIHNGNVFSGSGQTGSYVMLLSTSTSDLAIDVQNNATGLVVYASKGGITIHNNVSVTEVTGYKVILQNNAQVQYSSGVVNIFFSSGTGGSWKVTDWQEK